MNWKQELKNTLKDLVRLNKSMAKSKELQGNEYLGYVNRCCQLLQELGIIDSQYQFSEQFLGRSKNYYGVVLCENRNVNTDVLYELVQNMKQLKECFADKQEIQKLIQKGQELLHKRIAKYL